MSLLLCDFGGFSWIFLSLHCIEVVHIVLLCHYDALCVCVDFVCMCEKVDSGFLYFVIFLENPKSSLT